MPDLISATLCDELLAVFEDPDYRPPPLPEVAFELMALSARQETNVAEVVSLLERDEMLAATVLRLVDRSGNRDLRPVVAEPRRV
jgi:HD-like signal output (HDOD) protein